MANRRRKEPAYPRISQADFSVLVGITPSATSQLVARGILTLGDDNLFDLPAVIREYIAMARNGRGPGVEASESNIDYHAERARLTKARADEQEIRAAIARGEAISVEDAKEAATAIGAAVQSQIKALRASLPPMLEGMTPQQMTRKIAGETDKILLALSDSSLAIYKPKKDKP
jgi:phage terminase Nu1 subunit (DNA packaging protein)